MTETHLGSPSAGMVGEFTTELTRFGAMFSWRWLVYAILVVVTAVLLRRLADLVIRVGWRLGWDPTQRMGQASNLIDLAFVGLVTLLLLRPFFLAAPMIAPLGAAVLACIVAFAIPTVLHDLVAGIMLATRTTLREGDSVVIEGDHGIVRSLGLLHSRVRRGDASTTTIPNRLLTSVAVRVGRDRDSLSVSVRLPDAGDDPDRLRIMATLSPWRRAGSTPRFEHTERGVWLVLSTWATRNPAIVRRSFEYRFEGGAKRSSSHSGMESSDHG